MKFRVLLLSFFLVKSAWAQSVFAPQEIDLPAHLTSPHQNLFISGDQHAFNLNITDSYLPLHLQSSLTYFAGLLPMNCTDERSNDYAIAMTIRGDYQGCYQYVNDCPSKSLAFVIQGARCAAADYEYKKAYDLFKSAIPLGEAGSGLLSAYIIEFSSLALYSNYTNEVDDIINLNPAWNAEEKNRAKGLVEYLGAGLPSQVSKQEVFDFVDQQISMSEGFYSKFLRGIRISNYLKDYQHQKAYNYLVQDAIQLTNPLDWWRQGFNTLYAISDGLDYTSATNFYQAYLPFTNSRLNTLPVERNVFNYTKIVSEVCKDKMLQEPEKSDFKGQLDLWRQGKMGIDQLVTNIKNKSSHFLDRSDVMSTLGSLQSIQGQFDEARESYWKAHQLCAFNNRSHWGLVLLERRKKYLSFPEFAANEEFIASTLKKILFPVEIVQFIPNLSSFPENSQNRIRFASRIWAPFIKAMYTSGHKAYIKLPFERLSEVEGFANLKDARIGPPDMPNYLFDNRLWDDVRGAGGDTVAADHDEVFQTVHGDYNLLGHEMAHQFHSYIKVAKPALNECINKLYDNAKSRGIFSDGYAKSTVAEYFAQGITYYLIPESFPARYGTNKSWSKKFDGDMYSLMVSIDEAGGDLNKIVCPVAL